MNEAEVLVLSGSPGSGKSTLADAIADRLRETSITHAVIDLDEFANLYNAQDSSVNWTNRLKWANLAAVWPNYVAVGKIKIIITVVIETSSDMEAIRAAAFAATFTVCELTAPIDILKERVTDREPNDYWKQRLRGLVESYNQRSDEENFPILQYRLMKKH